LRADLVGDRVTQPVGRRDGETEEDPHVADEAFAGGPERARGRDPRDDLRALCDDDREKRMCDGSREASRSG
jgi:hypothetical protein